MFRDSNMPWTDEIFDNNVIEIGVANRGTACDAKMKQPNKANCATATWNLNEQGSLVLRLEDPSHTKLLANSYSAGFGSCYIPTRSALQPINQRMCMGYDLESAKGHQKLASFHESGSIRPAFKKEARNAY